MFLLLFSAFLLGAVSSQILDLREGDECRPLGGGQGICRALRDCKTAGDFKKNQPPICTFKGKEPVICCPNTLATRTKAGTRADKYCQTIYKSCGAVRLFARELDRFDDSQMKDSGGTSTESPEGRQFVHGGIEAGARGHKYMVLIGYGQQNQISWGCGGSLINARYVLSAAHCVNPSTSLGMARWARLGDLDLSSNTEDAKPIDMRIIERIPYPDYIDTQAYHDIAIFKLERDVVFNPWILPICLHTKRDIETRTSTVIGWGRTDFAEGTSDKLLEANLEVYNGTECNRLMFSSPSARTPRGYLSDLMFCAGVPDGSKDACLGDSGGPLIYRKIADCIKTQIGITSYGNQCGLPNSPGVYTRVSNYISWIEDVVFGDEIIV